MGQMQHQKPSLHTSISSKKSCFIVRNLSEMVGQMGQMEDKWDVHLSRQSGGQMVCGSIRHTPYVLLSTTFGYFL